MKKKLVLRFRRTANTIDFAKELQERYFPPGTHFGENLKLKINSDSFEITLLDTPRNRSAVSVIASKHGIMPPEPLTKFDEYMKLVYQGKTRDVIDVICTDVCDYVNKHFGPIDRETIVLVFCNKKIWNDLGEKWGKKSFLDETTATVASDCSFNPSTGAVYSKKGHHVIFLNIEAFNRLNPQDLVLNYASTIFHEFVHISGLKDDVKTHMLEFKFSKEFLGIHHSKDYIKEKFREIKNFFSNKNQPRRR